MDPKLTEQLQQMLTGLLASAQDASVWAKGQIPLLVQEKILFGRVWNTGLTILCAVVAVIAFRAAKRFLGSGYCGRS